MKASVFLSLLLPTIFTTIEQIHSFEDGDEDTVIINADPNSSPRSKRQFSFYPAPLPADVSGPVEGSPCESLANSQTGTCTTVSDCYPLIYASEGEENRDPGLVDTFKQRSGVCPLGGIPLGYSYSPYYNFLRTVKRSKQPDELICCISGQQGGKPIIQNTPPLGEPEKFVVGGTPVADITRFPWMISMHLRGRHSCGGSLITPSTVLTAAHCVKDLTSRDVAGMKIYFGHHDISQQSAVRGLLESRSPSQVKYHRGFSMRTLNDDIALVILNSPAPTNAKIKPVGLGTVGSSDRQVTVSGWGQTSWTSPTSSRLLEATMDVWSHSKCQLKYTGFQVPVQITDQKQVCAGSPGRDSCRGDSGGPLHVLRGNSWEQVGIVSFGGKCGEYPGVYTRPTAYSAWIQKNQKM